jgi:hypothetical protein
MAISPTVVTSRRRQHELLRSWTGWPLTSVLSDPAEVAQVRDSGWSGTHHRDPETGERIVGTAAGLGFGVDDSWHNPAEVIPWSELEAIARAVPDEVREQLVEFRTRWRQHQSAYPRFTASAAAVGCGPIVAGEPLTARQEAYVREHEAFEASGVLRAWEKRRADLDAERLDLHGRAMGLSAGSEAGDLLELLDDQRLDRDTKPVDSAASGATGAEIRACVEDEHGHVTSTDVADDEAEFFTVYEPDRDGLPQAVSDHPTRGTAQPALEDRQGAAEGQAADPRPDDQVREQVSRLRKGKPTRINDVPVQKTGTYGRDRRPVFLIGSPVAGGPHVSVVGDKIVPSALRRQQQEMEEYNELPEAGKDAYDEARIRREAFHHRQAMRAAHEAIVPVDQDASSARPALLPPPPSTSGSAAAAARSTGIAPHPRGVGR